MHNEPDGYTRSHDCAKDSGCNATPVPIRSAAEIQDWIATYIAKELGASPDQVDVSVPFEHFAIDSATAIGMTGDLESWLGCRIDPIILYDYPTIRDVAAYLTELTSASASS